MFEIREVVGRFEDFFLSHTGTMDCGAAIAVSVEETSTPVAAPSPKAKPHAQFGQTYVWHA